MAPLTLPPLLPLLCLILVLHAAAIPDPVLGKGTDPAKTTSTLELQLRHKLAKAHDNLYKTTTSRKPACLLPHLPHYPS